MMLLDTHDLFRFKFETSLFIDMPPGEAQIFERTLKLKKRQEKLADSLKIFTPSRTSPGEFQPFLCSTKSDIVAIKNKTQ